MSLQKHDENGTFYLSDVSAIITMKMGFICSKPVCFLKKYLKYKGYVFLVGHLDRLDLLCLVKESENEVAQSCPTVCNPTDCSLPGSSVLGIFQARVLQWVGISSFRRSSQPRD